jgi:YggT family protein
METTLAGYRAFVEIVRYVVFGLAVVAALFATVDWAVRTRKLNPFGAIARFFRKVIDPLMLPIETRIVRRGGQPQNAPWYTLVFIIVGGLILFALLDLIGEAGRHVVFAVTTPGRFFTMLLNLTILALQVALLVRVISTWVNLSPYSRWIRWSYSATEWMLAPIRRLLPTFGPVDVSPMAAFLLLWLIQSNI